MIVLCGKTCSGKNHIRDILLEKGVEPVVTYTTRPMRKGEIQDKTYHFLSREDFLQKVNDDFFVEFTSYNLSSGGTRYYGSHFSKEDEKKVIILNPDGVNALVNTENLEVTPVVFLLDAPNDVLIQRSIKRGDDQEEVKKRLEIDSKDFYGIEKNVDMVLRNCENADPEKIAKTILDFHEQALKHPLPWKPLKNISVEKDKKKHAGPEIVG